MQKIITLSIFILGISIGYSQSISGTAAVSTGLDYTYTFSGTANYVDPVWEASGGIVVSETAGAPYKAVVHWTIPGSGYIRFRNGGILATKTTTITDSGVPVPVTTFTITNNCGNTIVTRDSNPTASYDWYWQTTKYGTSTTLGNANSITRTVATNFYLRAKSKNTPFAWSTTSLLISGITVGTTAPAAPTVSTGATGFANASIPLSVGTVSGATIYRWYTQATGGTALPGISTASYSATGLLTTTTFYVSASNGCESTGRKSVIATVVPRPMVQVQNGMVPNIVFGKSITLMSPLPYDTYSWTDGSNQIVSTSSTCVVSQTGSYTLTVTKAGIVGPGISLPFNVGKGTNGLNMNFIITNTILANNLTDTATITGYPIDSVNQSIQYFDGLGRPLQTVLTQASPSKNDIVQPVVYDAFGRELKKYLQFVPSEGSGWYKSNFIDASGNYTGIAQNFYEPGSVNDIADDTSPFAQAIIEASPLNRVLKQGAPGSAWQPNTNASSDHSVKVTYEFNKVNEVILFNYVPVNGSVNHYVTSGTNGVPSYYTANQLYATKTLDEHNNEIIEFMNKQGQKLLKKVQYAAGKYTLTYYVYDDLGQLCVVLPPEAVNRLAVEYFPTSITQAKKESFLTLWAYRYKYDGRLRMIEKQVPGIDPVYLVYDDRDRLVMTQDGNQRKDASGNVTKKEWSFTKYDTLNRPVMTGVYTHGTVVNQLTMAGLISKIKFCESFSNSLITNHGYTSNVFPKTGYKALAITYYDDYRFCKMISDSANYFYSADGLGIGSEFKNSKNLLTGTKINILNSNTYLWSASYYDEKLRLIQVVSQNHKSGRDRITTTFDFTGRATQTKTNHTTLSTSHATYRKMVYDHVSRLAKISHKINSEPWIILTQNKYNELGQLICKKNNSRDNGTTFAQKTDFEYTIRGWIKKINDPTTPEVGDLFSTELKYDAPTTNGGIAQFNGNISETILKSVGINMQSYGYYYDTLNRLKEARYFDLAKPAQNGRYNEIVGGVNNKGYDLNGNIIKLTRNGKMNALPYQGTFDNLKYYYVGNQLKVINDAVTDNANEEGFKELVEKTFKLTNTNAKNEYAYDANGSMIKDDNKGLALIAYNYLNSPRKVYKSGADSIVYTYDAVGRKLTQQVYGATPKLTDYLGEFLYENNTLQFVTHEEGRLIPDASAEAPHPWEYQYFLKDHLGNVRVTFTTQPSVDTSIATFEDAYADAEVFKNVNTSTMYWVSKSGANNTSPGQYVMRMNNTYPAGPAKTLEVFPGDVIKAEVWSYFEGSNGFGATNQTNANLILAVAAAFGGVPGGAGESGAIYNGVNSAYTIHGAPSNLGDPRPTAHLNYILFDKNYGFLDMGFLPVPSNANMTKKKIAFTPITVKEVGYIYVYLSYSGDGVNWVYFDDLKITNTKSSIIASNDYYPFGLTYNSFSRENSVNQDYKYNGKELQNELALNWLDYGARMYMPETGRWGVVDPKSELLEMSSPYVYSLNSPVIYIDKDGELPILINGRVGNDLERGTDLYWKSEILNTIGNSGIPNPGGERHTVDGDRYQEGGGSVMNGSFWNGNSSSERKAAGYTIGKADFKTILSKLQKDPKTGKVIEKIQIYTHSRGAAFGIGYTEALLEEIKNNSDLFADPSNVIDFVYNMAPHQSNSLTAPNGVDEYTQDHTNDILSGDDMKGVKAAFKSDEKSTLGAHQITGFVNDLSGFLKSFKNNGENSTRLLINDFVRRMRTEYGIKVDVN